MKITNNIVNTDISEIIPFGNYDKNLNNINNIRAKYKILPIWIEN